MVARIVFLVVFIVGWGIVITQLRRRMKLSPIAAIGGGFVVAFFFAAIVGFLFDPGANKNKPPTAAMGAPSLFGFKWGEDPTSISVQKWMGDHFKYSRVEVERHPQIGVVRAEVSMTIEDSTKEGLVGQAVYAELKKGISEALGSTPFSTEEHVGTYGGTLYTCLYGALAEPLCKLRSYWSGKHGSVLLYLSADKVIRVSENLSSVAGPFDAKASLPVVDTRLIESSTTTSTPISGQVRSASEATECKLSPLEMFEGEKLFTADEISSTTVSLCNGAVLAADNTIVLGWRSMKYLATFEPVDRTDNNSQMKLVSINAL